MRKFRIPYIPYRSLLLSTTVLNDIQRQTRVTTDDTIRFDEKKRKASVVAQKRLIYDCLKDNGTPVLFCLSPERLS